MKRAQSTSSRVLLIGLILSALSGIGLPGLACENNPSVIVPLSGTLTAPNGDSVNFHGDIRFVTDLDKKNKETGFCPITITVKLIDVTGIGPGGRVYTLEGKSSINSFVSSLPYFSATLTMPVVMTWLIDPAYPPSIVYNWVYFNYTLDSNGNLIGAGATFGDPNPCFNN